MKTIVKFGVPLVLSSVGLTYFIDRWENARDGTHLMVYADKLANNLPTACGGVTKHTSPYPVIVGDVWSADRCEEVLRMVLTNTQLKLVNCFKVRINQSQFDAFSSHAHNFGVGATCASKAMGATNAGMPVEGCKLLSQTPYGEPNWSFVTLPDGKKQFVRGLYNRRKAETELCLRGFV
jgi:lysozyme